MSRKNMDKLRKMHVIENILADAIRVAESINHSAIVSQLKDTKTKVAEEREDFKLEYMGVGNE